MSERSRWFLLLVALLMLAPLAGCGPDGPKRYQVHGKVTFSDGSVPQGGVRLIRFEPASFAEGKAVPGTKTAQADINDDGTYRMSTVDDFDGVLPGEYKVTFTIRAGYTDGRSGLDPKYGTARTTPITVVVGPDSEEEMNFEIERAK
jgi:hypothetical protein